MSVIDGNAVDPRQVKRFSALAKTWWDPDGPMKPLHHMNPVRLSLICAWIQAHFQCKDSAQPFSGLSLLDIGCGGGLVAEAMAKLGAHVVAIDPCQDLIDIAHAHAHANHLEIDYRCCNIQDLQHQQEYFDIILALEVIEHVPHYADFLQRARSMLTHQAMVIVSTLNRTKRSLLLAKFMAEYVLRWLPPGSHDWQSFLKPSEVITALAYAGLLTNQIRGLVFNPLLRCWQESTDISVNYLLAAHVPSFA